MGTKKLTSNAVLVGTKSVAPFFVSSNTVPIITVTFTKYNYSILK